MTEKRGRGRPKGAVARIPDRRYKTPPRRGLFDVLLWLNVAKRKGVELRVARLAVWEKLNGLSSTSGSKRQINSRWRAVADMEREDKKRFNRSIARAKERIAAGDLPERPPMTRRTGRPFRRAPTVEK